jgi:Domain of unknown function (DUF222)
VAAAAAPASVSEALGMLEAAMDYLAGADAAAMPAAVQARCLQTLERTDAVEVAARARVLGAFTASQGYCEDGAYSPRSWLVHQTRVNRGVAAGHAGWARRAARGEEVIARLAAKELSESFARAACGWADQLPAGERARGQETLLDAVRDGVDLRDLNALGKQMVEEAWAGIPDREELAFEDRVVRVETTIGGAGVIHGDLTPECAAALSSVLESLSAPAGSEDTRSRGQRYHDALEEAMRRLMAAGLLPGRAGQPAKVWAHISLADLLVLDPGATVTREWVDRTRARWAAARAAASVAGGDGGAWLDGAGAAGFACDASITPVITGEVDPGALADLVRLCVELAGYGPGRRDGSGDGGEEAGPRPLTGRGREALEQAVIGKAVDLLSGPGGLASYLRRRLLGARLGGPSLPLDVGMSENVPAGIRNAVRLRDQHCRFPGGCWQPAAACEVHHVRHKARGGKTSVKDCVLLCWFHHHVVIHQWGWTLVLNPDGTTTAWNKERTKTLRSHSPPARTG